MTAKNEMRLPSFGRLLLLLLLLPLIAWGEEPAMGRVTGSLALPAGRECRGVASLWPGDEGRVPDPRRYLIIPFSAVPLSASCTFELAAPPGDYYLGALVRATPGPEIGPPRVGDRVFMTPDPDGKSLRLELGAGEHLDVGRQQRFWTYAGMEELRPPGVTGRVRDSEGRPVAGVLVFAFADPELTRQPLAVSARTGVDGRYALRLDHPGDIYLRVKDDYRGGAPLDGGHVGVYGGAVPMRVAVGTKELVGDLDIEVLRVPAGRTGKRDPASPRPASPTLKTED
ncbi:carboxypeptidase-like regulatory domain-containing protein [Trichloromonas acetexigens]|uniref:Carboxypeptidase regulatory-like domain-containing protein n=1 Tax=Trichloromonas acetexigens TaxID=38815 RepID=A0A550JFG6_9BACT|nr:carboxypeptidase-like regulatory domain-containing protein [Desulfuromonas acetexigens]TRO81950.1 carboxypeptidase regulatory-like domain-containing protein [Desulfuromonas acetexigens]